MLTSDFDYPLPDELIAQAPAEPRDSCRLLVLHRRDGSIEHRIFSDIVEYLHPGDLLVANRTRVLPARLMGRKRGTGGVAETLLLTRREDLDPYGGVWECLVNPGKRLKQGAVIEYRAGGVSAPDDAPVVLTGEVVDFVEGSRGGRLVRFTPAEGFSLDTAIHEAGRVPLPPSRAGAWAHLLTTTARPAVPRASRARAATSARAVRSATTSAERSSPSRRSTSDSSSGGAWTRSPRRHSTRPDASSSAMTEATSGLEASAAATTDLRAERLAWASERAERAS